MADNTKETTFTATTIGMWRERVESDLKGRDFERAYVIRSLDGIAVPPLFVGGESTPVGGMSRGDARGWRTEQRYQETDIGETAAAIADDLANGATGICLVPDGEFRGSGSERGIALRTEAELHRLLANVPKNTTIAVRPGLGAPLAATWLAGWGATGELRLGFDPIGVAAATDTVDQYVSVPGDSTVALAAAFEPMVAVIRKGHLRGRAILASSVPVHDAGCSAGQELGFLLSSGIAALRGLGAHGVSPTVVAESLEFEICVGRDIFEDIAKLRALRACWRNVLTASGVDTNVATYVHAKSAWRTHTLTDPWVNMLRTTTETFSASIGGCDSLSTLSYDIASRQPSALGRRLARNTQLVLREECHLDHVADPAAGSDYIEWLTRQLSEKGWAFMQAIEGQGSALAAVESGWVAEQIGNVVRERDVLIAKRKMPLTGTSEYPNASEELLAQWPALAARGAGRETKVGSTRRFSAAFEALRQRGNERQTRGFLATLGTIPQYKARAAFATRALEAIGVGVAVDSADDSPPDVYADHGAIVAAFRSSGATVCAICGTDTQYVEQVEPLAAALKSAGASVVLVAGRAGEAEHVWRDAGVDDMVYMGCDLLAVAERLYAGGGAA